MVPTTAFVLGSIRSMVSSSQPVIAHSAPSPVASSQTGMLRTVTTKLVAGSRRMTSPGGEQLQTKTAFAPVSRWDQRPGPLACGRRRVATRWLVAGSTCSKALSLRTQTLPAPTAMSVGVRPSPIVRTIFRDLGSMRSSVLSSRLPTQTDPSPTAGPVGLPPTGISPTIALVSGSMTATESPASFRGDCGWRDELRLAAATTAATTRTSATTDATVRRVRNRRPDRLAPLLVAARRRLRRRRLE